MDHRLRTIVGVLGLASAFLALAASPAAAAPTQPQTVTFTSAAPQGEDWFIGHPVYGYAPTASASSGLPVTFSIDPASVNVCGIISGYGSPTSPVIGYSHAGTCTIHADQAGDDVYLPAPQATQSFVVEKQQPQLSVLRQNGPSPTRTFRATLTHLVNWSSLGWYQGGFPGQTVTFSVAGHPVCSGTTNNLGVATCTKRLPPRDWFKLTFTASYAGDDDYKPVSRKGPTFGDRNPVEPHF